MKLTDEMRAAFDAAAESIDAVPQGMSVAEWMFLAGYRMGARDMRERAASVCEATSMDQMDCATAIRSLPIEDEA